MPGTQTPPTNGSGVTEDPSSPRNVSVTTDGGLSVLKLAVTSAADCGVIQSPGTYPTSSGVIEALVKFSGFTNASGHCFADWASLWLYGPTGQPAGRWTPSRPQYGNSFVCYHYGTTERTPRPPPTRGPTPRRRSSSPRRTARPSPAAPNILPDAWTYVTLAFGKDAGGNFKCDVYYNGVALLHDGRVRS